MTLAEAPMAQGKVRDLYPAGQDLLMVASDRISAFDVVLPTPIPGKGQVLTGLPVRVQTIRLRSGALTNKID